jgi:hypothetical protein
MLVHITRRGRKALTKTVARIGETPEASGNSRQHSVRPLPIRRCHPLLAPSKANALAGQETGVLEHETRAT